MVQKSGVHQLICPVVYPTMYKVLAPSKCWLFGISEPSTVARLDIQSYPLRFGGSVFDRYVFGAQSYRTSGGVRLDVKGYTTDLLDVLLVFRINGLFHSCISTLMSSRNFSIGEINQLT